MGCVSKFTRENIEDFSFFEPTDIAPYIRDMVSLKLACSTKGVYMSNGLVIMLAAISALTVASTIVAVIMVIVQVVLAII